MSKLKLGVIIFVSFIIGVWVGTLGSNSSTTGKISNDNKEDIRQTTVQSGSDNPSASPKSSPESAGKVEVKSQTKRMDIGYTEVVGEVINNTQNAVSSVKVTATFYDAGGKVIATGIVYAGDTTNTPLAAGATTPFNVSSYPDKINADSFKLDVTWR